jgi:hypothetical protein
MFASMIDLQYVQTLRDSKKWDELTKTLECSLGDLNALSRIHVLIWTAQAYRNLGHVEMSRANLRHALKDSESIPMEFGTENWLNLARELQSDGLLREAYHATSYIAADERPPASNVMIDRLKAAFAVEEEFSSSNVNIVSLGQSCIPDDIVKRWGFGRLYIDGPFSAGVFFGEGVSRAIEEDFSKYNMLSSFQIDNTASGFASASLPAYHTLFNHEVGEDWIDNDLARLRNLYAQKISNFRSITASRACVFVFSQHSNIDAGRLQNAIDRMAPARKRLLILDFCSTSVDKNNWPEWVHYVPCSFPYGTQESVWFLPEYFDSDIGFSFEGSLAASIAEGIRQIA